MTTINASKEIGEGKDKIKKTADVSYEFGENVAAAIKNFGEDVVFTNFKKAAVITAQGIMRRYLVAGKSPEEIVALMANWKPGVASERVIDPVGTLMSQWDSYTPEKQAEILAKLKARK